METPGGTELLYDRDEVALLPSHSENAEGYVLIAVYLFFCMCVIHITQKVLNRIA